MLVICTFSLENYLFKSFTHFSRVSFYCWVTRIIVLISLPFWVKVCMWGEIGVHVYSFAYRYPVVLELLLMILFFPALCVLGQSCQKSVGHIRNSSFLASQFYSIGPLSLCQNHSFDYCRLTVCFEMEYVGVVQLCPLSRLFWLFGPTAIL